VMSNQLQVVSQLEHVKLYNRQRVQSSSSACIRACIEHIIHCQRLSIVDPHRFNPQA
jgi:hypothetical protein